MPDKECGCQGHAGMLALHESEKHRPVYVNPALVTFVARDPHSGRTIVGMVADDIGCEVDETPEEVAGMLGGFREAPSRQAQPAQQQQQRRPDAYGGWKARKVAHAAGKVEKAEKAEKTEGEKPDGK